MGVGPTGWIRVTDEETEETEETGGNCQVLVLVVCYIQLYIYDTGSCSGNLRIWYILHVQLTSIIETW